MALHIRKLRVHNDFVSMPSSLARWYGLPNIWFVCGSPFTKKTEITKTMKTTQTRERATNKELRAGFAEVTKPWK